MRHPYYDKLHPAAGFAGRPVYYDRLHPSASFNGLGSLRGPKGLGLLGLFALVVAVDIFTGGR